MAIGAVQTGLGEMGIGIEPDLTQVFAGRPGAVTIITGIIGGWLGGEGMFGEQSASDRIGPTYMTLPAGGVTVVTVLIEDLGQAASFVQHAGVGEGLEGFYCSVESIVQGLGKVLGLVCVALIADTAGLSRGVGDYSGMGSIFVQDIIATVTNDTTQAAVGRGRKGISHGVFLARSQLERRDTSATGGFDGAGIHDSRHGVNNTGVGMAGDTTITGDTGYLRYLGLSGAAGIETDSDYQGI